MEAKYKNGIKMSKHHTTPKELRKSDFESIEQSIEKDQEFSGEGLTGRTI